MSDKEIKKSAAANEAEKGATVITTESKESKVTTAADGATVTKTESKVVGGATTTTVIKSQTHVKEEPTVVIN